MGNSQFYVLAETVISLFRIRNLLDCRSTKIIVKNQYYIRNHKCLFNERQKLDNLVKGVNELDMPKVSKKLVTSRTTRLILSKARMNSFLNC